MKKILAVVLAGATILSMTTCSANETKTMDTVTSAEITTVADTVVDTTAANTTTAVGDETVYKIGVLQLVQHAALDQSNEGFFVALDDAGTKYEADQQNAAGEQSNCQTIAEKLMNDKDDLILAIATPVAQAVAGVTTEILTLLIAITDPTEPGLVDSNDEPGINVSDTSDLTPVSEQIDLMKQLVPDVKNVGILYCFAKFNSVLQADMAEVACDVTGLICKDYIVSSSSEIQTVVEFMIGEVDAIYASTDNMIATGMVTVAMIVTDNGIPVICGEAGMVEADGLATYDIDYFQLGYLAGQQAIDILVNGADVAKTPTRYLPADKCVLTVNETIADALGIDITGLKSADVVE